MKRWLLVLLTFLFIWAMSCSRSEQPGGQPQPKADTTQVDTTGMDTSEVDSL